MNRWDVDIEDNLKRENFDSKNQLATWFVVSVNKAEANQETKIAKACIAIERLMNDGWTLHDIEDEILKFAKDYPAVVTKIYHLEEIFVNKQPPQNLMQRDVFYYHNLLREVPPPVRIRRDPETGEYIRESAPFFLEMKRRFTMQDLLDYWYRTNYITPNDHMRKQDEGKFRYLLSIYSLDEILFAIDAAKVQRNESELPPLRNAFDLEKYMDGELGAREFIKRKENAHKVAGINRIIKRRD